MGHEICLQGLGLREQGSPAGNPDTHLSRFSQCQGLEIFLNPPPKKRAIIFVSGLPFMLIALKFYVEAKKIPQCSYNLTGSIFSCWDLKSSQFFSSLIP